jgi:glycosyltransferase involved in cell wall biosynthesis
LGRIRCVLDLQGAQSESRFRGIGRYSLNLALAMARVEGEHEMWIALNGHFADTIDPLRAKFDGLIPQGRIVTFDVPGPVAECEPANSWRRCAAERVREHFLSRLAPDVVHVSSLFEGFCDDAVTSVGVHDSSFSTAATLYDLIPLLLPDQYLSTPEMKDHYLRKAQWLKLADILFAISESSRREAIEALRIPEDGVVNISTGLDEQFRIITLSPNDISALFDSCGITRPFIMYSGAIDTRKNVEGLIHAFTLLPATIRDSYQLLLVGKHHPDSLERIQKIALGAGLRADAIKLAGYVKDGDLVALYNLCSLFVLPSFHEGFGLPVLEAMACGAPTIASNVTSLPEAVGRDDAMFDPDQPAAIAAKMQEVLTNESFRETLRHHGLRQCKKFTWDRSAKSVWKAFEELQLRKQPMRECALSPLTTRRRPRMAYFSPLPPERSGISDYSAELLPELARYYDIEVVVEQDTISDDWIAANFPARTVSYFERHASEYPRVLYQIGNSPFHVYMFDVLRRYPGVVVLHDFYLSAVLNWMEVSAGIPGLFSRAVFDSHGYSGLLQGRELGREWAVRTLPCSRRVIEEAAGVIVHSEFSRRLANKWYRPGTASNWKVLPFPRAPQQYNRNKSRASLSISEDDYVVCSFGLVDPTKLNDRLLSGWLSSRLANNGRCHLVFVGENNGAEYGRQLLDRIAASGTSGRIRITGFASPTIFRDYLSAADCAVQLRTDSRGETSAAVQDCLSYGIPTIINCHGSFAEVAESAVCKLPDLFSDAELSDALNHMYLDVGYRTILSQSARDLMRLEHHPARVAELYRDAVESFSMSHPVAVERDLLVDLSSIHSAVAPTQRDLLETARSIALQRRSGIAQLMLDVSATATNDLKTGIERVARNLSRELIKNPGVFRIEPVRLQGGQRVYARKFGLGVLNVQMELEETTVEFRSGDIYLALDWCPEAVYGSRPFFIDLRARNIPIYFTIYDLLPILRPDRFPDWASVEFRRWLNAVCEFSDGLACISRSVADELLSWLDCVQPTRWRPLKIGYFHLGAGIEEGESAPSLTPDSDMILSSLRGRPSVLMVGTIEPRKGHAQALAAFEQLWSGDTQANLVIVGKEGWHAESFVDRIRSHEELGKRLFWLSEISDEMLSQIYGAASVLLAASEGEGFGLPLIEGARHKLPLIARDIPVFREVAGKHAYYFEGSSAESLATALRAWLDMHSSDQAPSSEGLIWLSWKESTQQLMEVLAGTRVYREWIPSRCETTYPDRNYLSP